MTKLSHTSLTEIAISFLVMNLCTLLLGLFCVFLWRFFRTTSSFTSFINENYVLDNHSLKKVTSLECFFPQIALSLLLLDIQDWLPLHIVVVLTSLFPGARCEPPTSEVYAPAINERNTFRLKI